MNENNITDDEVKVEEQEKIIKDAKAPAKTNILNCIKFKNNLDKQIFDLLPLSDAQKEELILDVEFNTNIDDITDGIWNGRLSPTIKKDNSINDIKEDIYNELEEDK